MALAAVATQTGRTLAMLPSEQAAWDKWAATAIARPNGILTSSPMLQCPTPTSMGVAFAVNALSTGIVEVADNPDMKDARRIEDDGFPIMRSDDRIHLIRICGLKAGNRYWYRVGAAALVL